MDGCCIAVITSYGVLYTENIFSILAAMTSRQELQDKEIGALWRLYRPLEGRDDHADLILALIASS